MEPAATTSIACKHCGHLNDLRRVQRFELERTMTCRACGQTDRWTITPTTIRERVRRWEVPSA